MSEAIDLADPAGDVSAGQCTTEASDLKLRRKLVLLTAALSAVVAGVVVQQVAYADTTAPLVNQESNLCLQPLPDAFQSITDDGVRIAQMQCTGRREQQWKVFQLGKAEDPLSCHHAGCVVFPNEPFFYVINDLSGKCLDVTDGNGNDRAPIQQWTCNGGASEKWFKHPYAFSRLQYVNSRTAKCLDVPNQTRDQTYLWQFHCTANNSAQAFSFPASS